MRNRQKHKQELEMSTAVPNVPASPVGQTDSAEDVASLVYEMETWFLQLKRALAGFTTLQAALAGASGTIPKGERKKELPIFEFRASLVGTETREAVVCAVNLQKINPQYVGHVLIPIVNAFAAELSEALEEIAARVDTIRPVVSQYGNPKT